MPKSGSSKTMLTAGLGFGAAIGIALGALVLAPNIDSSASGGNDELREEHRKVLQDSQILEAQSKSGDSIVGELAPDLVSGVLADRPVMIIRTADAIDGDVKAVSGLLESAGARDAGTITLDRTFFLQENADELKSLVANTLPAGAELSTDDLSVGTHAGNALAAALLMDPETAEPLASVKDRATLLQTLKKSGYIDYERGTILPAQAVLVVSGRGGDEFYTENLPKFVTALDEAGDNTVFAGRIEEAADGGIIDQIRALDSGISTVDSIGNSWARMAAVLALAEQLNGGNGHYGASASAEAASPAVKQEGN